MRKKVVEDRMKTVYKYKQKYVLRVILFLIFGVFALALSLSGRMIETLVTGLILVFLQIVILIHYLGKRLVVDEKGITVLAFWGLPVNGAP
jgi:hypothetical protein